MANLTYLGGIFQVTEQYEDIVDAVLTKGRERSSQRIYFESADFEVKGSSILQRHEILSPDGVPERLRIDNILLRHKMSTEQATKYKEYMLKAGFDYSQAILELDHRIKKEGAENTLSWLEIIAQEMEGCDVGEDDALHHSNGEEIIPATYGFHKIDSIYDTQPQQDWLEKQPHLVRRLITTPKRCKTIEQLKKLGQKCYQAANEPNATDYQKVYSSLTNAQQEVFWDAYNQRKRELMSVRELTDTAKALINQIYDAVSLPKMKAKLVRIQKGQFKIRDPPDDLEWNIIWNHYREREYELLNPLAEIPEGYSRCGYCYQEGGVMYMPKMDVVTGKMPIYDEQKRLHCLSCTGF
jgi:hypothetical protein